MPPKIPKYVLPLSVLGSVVGGIVIFKDRLWGGRYMGEERVAGKTILITGTTSGIGKATATEMAKRGGRILMACRDVVECEKVRQEIMEATYNKNIHCHKLDLASMKSIRECAENINANEKRLDVLINNAGVMVMDKQYTEDGFEEHLGVNYLGPYLLTHLLLDKMKASAPGRIINIGSIGYQRAHMEFGDFNMAEHYDSKEAYMRSKASLSMFTGYLAENELKDTGVNTYLVVPGLVDTKLTRNIPMKKSFMSRFILAPVWWVLLSSPEQAMQQILYCALSPEETDVSGHVYKDSRRGDLEGVTKKDKEQKRLDLISKKWTRLS